MSTRKRLHVWFLTTAALGCYEIEPQIPRDYVGSQAEAGWPPPAVYTLDPFHPSNRLFHRLFVLGVEGPRGDLPFSPRESLKAVDQAEVMGLLEELEKGEKSLAAITDPVARAAMQSDLLAFLARVWGPDEPLMDAAGAEAAPEVKKELARAVRALAAPVPAGPEDLPPPLRKPGWTEAKGPGHAAFRPSAHDLRWTRIFRREGEALLLRQRIGAGPGGEPALLSLGSEAWLLSEAKEGPPVPRIYHYRRTRHVRGEDPWEEVPSGATVRIRDPDEPRRPPRKGDTRSLCAGCHPGPGLRSLPRPEVTPRAGEAPPASPDDQLQDARRVLAKLLGTKSP